MPHLPEQSQPSPTENLTFSRHHQELATERQTPYPLVDFFFSTQQKLKTLFMKLGVSHLGYEAIPVEMISELGYNYEQRKLFLQDLQVELKHMGFLTDIHEDGTYTPEEAHPYIFFHYGDRPEYFQAIAQSKDDYEAGLLNGYPQTAVEGVITNNVFPKDQQPDFIARNPLAQHSFLFLSRTHFQEEWTWYLKNLQRALDEQPKLVKALGLEQLLKEGLSNRSSIFHSIFRKLIGKFSS